ncbi:MAG: hypothetical protein ACI8RD_009442, partial [Bacillariaceae sp.]
MHDDIISCLLLFFDLFRLLCLDSCRLKINDSYTNRNRNDV